MFVLFHLKMCQSGKVWPILVAVFIMIGTFRAELETEK